MPVQSALQDLESRAELRLRKYRFGQPGQEPRYPGKTARPRPAGVVTIGMKLLG
jgi:hypothetical protein